MIFYFLDKLYKAKEYLNEVVLLSLCWVAQLIVMAGFLSTYIPFPIKKGISDIFFHYRKGFNPERELELYGLMIISCIFMGVVGLWVLGGQRRNDIKMQLNKLLCCEAVLTLLMLVSVLCWINNIDNLILRNLFLAICGVSILQKLFWPEIQRFVPTYSYQNLEIPLFDHKLLATINQKFNRVSQWRWFDGIVFLLIFLLLWIVDMEAVVAQFYMGDYFHIWDVVVMGTIYGLFQGLIPLVDMNATYGLGMTTLLHKLMEILGGFDYVNLLKSLVILGIGYMFLWYLLLKRMFKIKILALIAILLGIRIQMFSDVVLPMTWNEVQSCVLRFIYDVGFFWSLYLLLVTNKQRWWIVLCLMAGLSLYHMPSTGIFLFLSLVLLNVLIFIQSTYMKRCIDWSILRYLIGLCIGSLSVMMFLMYQTVGTHLITKELWVNFFEWTSYFSKGFFYGSLISFFQSGQYVLITGSMIYVLVYLGVFMGSCYRFIFLNSREALFFGILAFYGMGLFTYFIGMSHKYVTIGLPGIFILFWILDKFLGNRRQGIQSAIITGLLILTIILLFDARLFKAYPNLLNRSANPVVDPAVSIKINDKVRYFHQLSVDFPHSLKVPVNSLGVENEDFKYEQDFVNHAALKSYYRMETSFKEDVALIQSLTTVNDRVALVSSFEVLLLSNANRKPFFYYFPLLNSHPLTMRNFVVTTIFSYSQLQRVLKQLHVQKPKYVFIERVFLTSEVPLWYGEQFEDLIAIIRYIYQEYEPIRAGKYLVAMQRKERAK